MTAIEYLQGLIQDKDRKIEALEALLADHKKQGEELGMTADESRRLYEELLADKNRKIEALESELIGKECDILEMTETLDAHFSLIRQALKMLAMLDPGPDAIDDDGATIADIKATTPDPDPDPDPEPELEMKFSPEMVKAILTGRKTETRRPSTKPGYKPPRAGNVVRVVTPNGLHADRFPIRLEVKQVYTERLRAIAAASVLAEGFASTREFVAFWEQAYAFDPEFRWGADPLVWVIKFRLIGWGVPHSTYSGAGGADGQ